MSCPHDIDHRIAELAELERRFDAAGGRGVALAEQIDELRRELNPESYPRDEEEEDESSTEPEGHINATTAELGITRAHLKHAFISANDVAMLIGGLRAEKLWEDPLYALAVGMVTGRLMLAKQILEAVENNNIEELKELTRRMS